MKTVTKTQRRSLRKKTYPLQISQMVLCDSHTPLTRGGRFIEVSSNGFKVLIERNDFLNPKYSSNLDCSDLIGLDVWIHLADFDLILNGTIQRTRFIGQGKFEFGIDFTHFEPDYWREVLFDLLPNPKEFE